MPQPFAQLHQQQQVQPTAAVSMPNSTTAPISNGIAGLAKVQPQAPQPGLGARAFSGFARGMMGPEKTQALDDQFKAQKLEKAKRALTWMENTAQIPVERRAAYTLENAQTIASETGQPYEKVVASAQQPDAFSDEAISEGMAQLRSVAGIAPDKAQYQAANLGNGGFGAFDPRTGKIDVQREPDMKPEKPATPTTNGGMQYVDGKWVEIPGYAENYLKMHPPSLNNAGGADMSDDAIQNAAQMYNSTGVLPSLGSGAIAATRRVQILNMAAEQAAAAGDDGKSLAAQHAAFKAASTSLSQITKQKTMISSFEKTFEKNITVAEGMLDKVDNKGSPIYNKWVNAGRKSIGGDPDVAAFHAAVMTLANEYAKIMSGSMGNTALSDSARKEAEEMINSAMSPEQFRAVVKLLRTDASNRMSSLDEERATLVEQLGGQPAPSADIAPEQAPAPTQPQAPREATSGAGRAPGTGTTPFVWGRQPTKAGTVDDLTQLLPQSLRALMHPPATAAPADDLAAHLDDPAEADELRRLQQKYGTR